MAKAESHPFQKQRDILQEFRQVAANRAQQEKEAEQLWQAEQQDADAVLKRALKEAEKRRDQEEARITELHQKSLQEAEARRTQTQQEAEQRLEKTESETRARYQSELSQAEATLAQVRKEAQERKQKEEKEIRDRYEAEVQAAGAEWTEARNMATEKQTKIEEHWKEIQIHLNKAGLLLHQLIPVEIPSVSPEQFPNKEDPAQALQNSLNAVQEIRKAIQSTLDELLHWRETRRRIRNLAIGIVVITIVIVLIGLSIRWNAQIQEMARQATVTANQATVIANQPVAAATAQAIQATISAVATSTPESIFGPVDGTVHSDGEYCIDTGSVNFVAEVTFINPPVEPKYVSSGYGFRYVRYYHYPLPVEVEVGDGRVDYTTWVGLLRGDIRHSASYGHAWAGFGPHPSYTSDQIKTKPGESNKLKLIVYENSAVLLVNNIPGSRIDLSDLGGFDKVKIGPPRRGGAVCAVLRGFSESGFIRTSFKSFSVWTLP